MAESESRRKSKEILASLDKKTRDRLLTGEDIETDYLETPSLALTAALNGGWAMGRQVMIWGPRSAGKTTFLLEQIALAQKKGLTCAYFDIEKTFDRRWAARLGVDTEALIVNGTGTMTAFVNDGAELMRAGIDLIGVDSITALMPNTYVDEDGELKPFEKTGAIGGLARSLSPALAQLNHVNHNTLLILVSQVRNAQKGSMYWAASPSGGNAVLHGNSQEIRLQSTDSQSNIVNGEVVLGDRIITKPIGRRVSWSVEKSKVGHSQGSRGEYILYFDAENVGIDNVGELLTLAVESGIINKAGAWYKYGDEMIGQGELKASERLRDDEELFKEIKEKLNAEG